MKKGVCGGGGSHFLKCLGRKFLGEELKFWGFAWGGTDPGWHYDLALLEIFSLSILMHTFQIHSHCLYGVALQHSLKS